MTEPPQNPTDAAHRRRVLLATAAALAIVAAGIGLLVTVLGSDDGDDGASTTAVDPRVQGWAEAQGFTDNEAAMAGANLFATNSCLTCHLYIDAGKSDNAGPDLTAIGASGMGPEFFASYVANPAALGGNRMPAYGKEAGGSLTSEQLLQIGAFLDASQGVD